jgi:hypothetical protein
VEQQKVSDFRLSCSKRVCERVKRHFLQRYDNLINVKYKGRRFFPHKPVEECAHFLEFPILDG